MTHKFEYTGHCNIYSLVNCCNGFYLVFLRLRFSVETRSCVPPVYIELPKIIAAVTELTVIILSDQIPFQCINNKQLRIK